jgi:hypothetical protein
MCKEPINFAVLGNPNYILAPVGIIGHIKIKWEPHKEELK